MGAKTNTPVVTKRREVLYQQQQPEAEPVSASKMIITGIVIGAVLCGSFVLFLMLSGSSSAGKPGNQVRSGQAQATAASNSNANTSQSTEASNNAATSQANKNGDSRNPKRRGYSSGTGSKYQDVYTVQGSGKAPKMVQSQ